MITHRSRRPRARRPHTRTEVLERRALLSVSAAWVGQDNIDLVGPNSRILQVGALRGSPGAAGDIVAILSRP